MKKIGNLDFSTNKPINYCSVQWKWFCEFRATLGLPWINRKFIFVCYSSFIWRRTETIQYTSRIPITIFTIGETTRRIYSSRRRITKSFEDWCTNILESTKFYWWRIATFPTIIILFLNAQTIGRLFRNWWVLLWHPMSCILIENIARLGISFRGLLEWEGL